MRKVVTPKDLDFLWTFCFSITSQHYYLTDRSFSQRHKEFCMMSQDSNILVNERSVS